MDWNNSEGSMSIPKRPLIAYFQFMREHRPLLQQNYPHLKLTELIKQCGLDWKNLSDTVKQNYEHDYKDRLKEYRQLLSSYTEEQLETLIKIKIAKKAKNQKRLMKKKRKALNMPKRPAGPNVFYLKNKLSRPGCTQKEMSKLLTKYSRKWTELPIEVKTKYFKMHYEDRKRYAKQIDQWENQMVKEGNRDIIRKKNCLILLANPLRTSEKDDSIFV